MARLPQELLRPAQWAIPTGLSGVPTLRRLVSVWAASLVAVALYWWFDLCLAWWNGAGVSGSAVLAASLAVGVWLHKVAVPVWRALHSPPGALLLQWQPPPPSHRESTGAGHAAPSAVSSCWHLHVPGALTAEAVEVRLVIDLQFAMLLSIAPVPARRARWCVVPDVLTDAHRLRVLLKHGAVAFDDGDLPSGRSKSTPDTSVEAAAAVASSRPMARSAMQRASHHMNLIFGRRHGANRVRSVAGRRRGPRSSSPSSGFPPTQIDPERRAP